METIKADLSSAQALALAQFVKRVGWSEIRSCAVDDAEAYEIRAAIAQVARAGRAWLRASLTRDGHARSDRPTRL